MSARSKTTADYFIRGSEVWHHKIAMAGKAILWVITAALLAGSATAYLWLLVFFNQFERSIFWYYRLASIESFTGFGSVGMFARRLNLPGVDSVTLLPHAVVDVTRDVYAKTFGLTWGGALIAAVIVAGIVAAYVARFYTRFGRSKGEAEFLRGTRLVEADALAELVKSSSNGAGAYTLAGVPIPAGIEMRNICAMGAMGTGKSQLMLDLADQVFERGRKSIIWDKTGEFTRLYFRPGKDVILNPFDQRYPGWNLFSEIRMVYEFEQISHSICPDPDNATANAVYFAAGARTVIASVLRKLWSEGKRTTAEAVEVLLTLSPAEISEYLKGTDASMFVSVDAAEQALGVMSTLVSAIQFLKHVPDGQFSIREWVQRDDDTRLFITSHETVHDVLQPLVAAYLDIAIRATMSREETREDRLWVWLDELSSLGKIPILKISLTEARRYGVVHVIGLHNMAQLRAIYGGDLAQTQRSNLQTYVVCRVSDEETQEALSRLLGVQELDEQAEGLSFGAAPSRDGTSVQTSRRELRIVLPSEIKMLPDCEGFLQLAGSYPVARVRWEYKPRLHKESAYLVRPDLYLSASEPLTKPNEPPAAGDKPITIDII